MVHFVGAGPGAVDLISVRGKRLLEAADVVVYAGSLVNPDLLAYCKGACEVLDSASMTLEEVVATMVDAWAQGKEVVRLHTGDPSLYGAIREQMDLLDRAGVPFDVCPGISAFSAAASALQAEYTLPGVSQTLIVSRAAGRTPVPEGEELVSLGAHGASMALYLSAGMAQKVQDDLLEAGYDPDTPAAIVFKASWPDERACRCTVASIAEEAARQDITKTALIVVGDFLGAEYERSKLYDPSFSHGFRQAAETEHDDDSGIASGRGEQNGKRERRSSPPRGGVELVAFTRRGCELACSLAAFLDGEAVVSAPEPYASEQGACPLDSLEAWTSKAFATAKGLVFVGATGIAVRSIAPYIRGKYEDPAVVCIDEFGRVAVPLLSGHVGGANELARAVAQASGGMAAISTATDLNGAFAIDLFARENGMAIVERELAKRISAALLAGEPVSFGDGLGAVVCQDTGEQPFKETLHLLKRDAVVGLGCRRGTRFEVLEKAVDQALAAAGIADEAVIALATIDVKSDEAAIVELARQRGWRLNVFTADELDAVEGSFSSSDFVRQAVGVDNVCERAVVACGARLTLEKQAGEGVTVALGRLLDAEGPGFGASVASTPDDKAGQTGLLYVVGIGPGAPSDMTLRAREALRESELVVGYKAYVDLVALGFPDKEFAASGMRQEIERCRHALEQAQRGRVVSLVCSGDAGVYGMASPVLELASEYPEVEVRIVAGVTAACAGAALLGAPLAHDFAVVSLSDLLTPWPLIESRLEAAAKSDLCLCLYNPASRKRPDHLKRACDIVLRYRDASTACGVARNIGREGQQVRMLMLEQLRDERLDMFATVFIGNSQTAITAYGLVTPRGYRIDFRGEA